MKEELLRQTQTSLAPWGNCWQTATACVIGVPAENLPDQAGLERWYEETKKGWDGRWPDLLGFCSYVNLLNVYLYRHHAALYTTVLAKYTRAIRVIAFGGLHLLEGPTVRTSESGIEHVIVGRNGDPVWDPHPSRAGLSEVKRWGIIAPLPRPWDPDMRSLRELPCPCPACGGLEGLEARVLKEAA